MIPTEFNLLLPISHFVLTNDLRSWGNGTIHNYPVRINLRSSVQFRKPVHLEKAERLNSRGQHWNFKTA